MILKWEKHHMKETTVMKYVKKWLQQQPQVDDVLAEQQLISGGLVADFLAKSRRGKILHIVECKGSVDIGELAKGLGQAYQYDYQAQKNRLAKNAKVLFICPEDMTKELDTLRVPRGVRVYLVSKGGTLFERKKHPVSKSLQKELQLPKTFYLRDVELNHLESIIRLIHKMGRKKADGLSRDEIQRKIKKEYSHIAARGYNHLITLKSLGLLNDRNLLTPRGHEIYDLITTSKEAFLREMCESFYPFIINVLNAIVVIAYEKGDTLNEIECTAKDIANKVCSIWGTKLRFLYDHRTIGTTLRILRELGAVEVIGTRKIKIKLKRFQPTDLRRVP